MWSTVDNGQVVPGAVVRMQTQCLTLQISRWAREEVLMGNTETDIANSMINLATNIATNQTTQAKRIETYQLP